MHRDGRGVLSSAPSFALRGDAREKGAVGLRDAFLRSLQRDASSCQQLGNSNLPHLRAQSLQLLDEIAHEVRELVDRLQRRPSLHPDQSRRCGKSECQNDTGWFRIQGRRIFTATHNQHGCGDEKEPRSETHCSPPAS